MMRVNSGEGGHAVISAVIPTHLRPELLTQAIESVASQTLTPCELFVVSDIEDGATAECVIAHGNKLPFPVHFLENRTNPGVCGSRNLGAAQARGVWLAFLDDDDVWRPANLEKAAARAETTGADLVISALQEISDARGSRARVFPEGLTPATLFEVPGGMTGSNMLVRREPFLSVGGFDSRVKVFNDWDLLFRLLALPVRYATIDEPLVEWRQHDGERIGTFSERRAAGLEFFVTRYREFMPERLTRELLATAAGMRRQLADGRWDRLAKSAALAHVLGPKGIFQRLAGERV